MTPQRGAVTTPLAAASTANVSKASACSKAGTYSSYGTAMEGVLERPWRSIGKTPLPAASPALSLVLDGTPMEGVPERIEQPRFHSTIRRQSQHSRLRTPNTAQTTRANSTGRLSNLRHQCEQLVDTPDDRPRPEILQRLHLPAADEAQLMEESPVVGLLQPQQQPDPERQQQHQASGAGRYGSLGFFGSLNSAPPLADSSGALAADAQ